MVSWFSDEPLGVCELMEIELLNHKNACLKVEINDLKIKPVRRNNICLPACLVSIIAANKVLTFANMPKL